MDAQELVVDNPVPQLEQAKSHKEPGQRQILGEGSLPYSVGNQEESGDQCEQFQRVQDAVRDQPNGRRRVVVEVVPRQQLVEHDLVDGRHDGPADDERSPVGRPPYQWRHLLHIETVTPVFANRNRWWRPIARRTLCPRTDQPVGGSRMDVSPVTWTLTVVGILALLAFDYVFHVRKAHAPTLKEAAVWSSVYVGIAVLFGLGVLLFG